MRAFMIAAAMLCGFATSAGAQSANCSTNRYNGVTTCTDSSGKSWSGAYNRYNGTTTLQNGAQSMTGSTNGYTGQTTFRNNQTGATMSGSANRYGAGGLTIQAPPGAPATPRMGSRLSSYGPPQLDSEPADMPRLAAGQSYGPIYDPSLKRITERVHDQDGFIYQTMSTGLLSGPVDVKYRLEGDTVVYRTMAGAVVSCRFGILTGYLCKAPTSAEAAR